jgi:hypothetical protein
LEKQIKTKIMNNFQMYEEGRKKELKDQLNIPVVMQRLWLVFIATGMIQMLLGRWIGVHNGLDHMVFTYWWQYVLEGLFYSLFHSGMYHYLKK